MALVATFPEKKVCDHQTERKSIACTCRSKTFTNVLFPNFLNDM